MSRNLSLYRFSLCRFVYEICISIVGSDSAGHFHSILVRLTAKNSSGFEVVSHFEHVLLPGTPTHYEYGKIAISWKEYTAVEGSCYE